MSNLYYVIDWGKQYSNITKWNNETKKRENIFPIKTKIPNYSDISFHWEYKYEPNYTLKGTINKREPKKLVEKIPIYKEYKWKIIEKFKHPNAGEWFYPDRDNREEHGKYTEENLLLLKSIPTDKKCTFCYIIIAESGVSRLLPGDYKGKQLTEFMKSNFSKWDRNNLIKEQVPKEIISCFYDSDDNVLYGSRIIKGLVSYHYIDSKFSKDDKCIFLYSKVLYDGFGNSKCPNPELIRDSKYIERRILNN